MSQAIGRLRKLFKQLDVFGAPINLNIDGKSSYQSALGGFMTFLMMTCIGVIFWFQTTDFLSRLNISVQVQQVFSADPQLVQLNQTNILFMVGIEQLNTSAFSERPFYNVSISQNIYNQITDERKTIEIPLQPCKIERFKEFNTDEYNISMEEVFIQSHFDRYLCPPSDFSLNLKGAPLSKDYQFVEIKVTKCKNDTNNSYWNPVCASPDEVKSYLIRNNALRFTLYTTNYVVNPEKTLNMTQIYMSQDLSYLFQPDVMVKLVGVNFRNYVVMTDNSLFITSLNQSQTWNYRESTSSQQQTLQNLLQVYKNELSLNDLEESRSAPLTINLKSDYFSMQAERKFMKIDALFSYFGGIFQVFFLFIGIFMIQYNSCFFRLRLVNRLYDFNEHNNQNAPPQKAPIFSKNKKVPQDFGDNVELSDVTNELKIREMGFKSRSEFLIWYLEKIILQKKKLKLTFDYTIYVLSCGRYHLNYNNKTIDKAFIKIDQDMNIKDLLNKVNQVDKLKRLILTKQQTILFNFFPKPSFHSQNKKKMDSNSVTQHHHKHNLRRESSRSQTKINIVTHVDYDSFLTLLNAYDTLTRTISSDETTIEINKKLIFLLGFELRSMFKASLLIQEQDLIEEGASALKQMIDQKHQNLLDSNQLSKLKRDQYEQLDNNTFPDDKSNIGNQMNVSLD